MVRIGVYNQGTSASGPFTVQWWPGENYGAPACSWTLDGMVARGGQILTCTYEGYPSWYGKINTKVVADPAGAVAESDESNNVYKKSISVSKPGSAPSGGSSPSGGSAPSGSGGVSGSPDLFISEFSMTPETPTQGSPVTVRVGVYNKGNSASGPFTVQWWPGENYGAPACSWTLDGMVARGGQILTCTYEGYPSWYGKINTKVVADPAGTVAESDESNNVYKKTISVSKPGSAPSGGSSPSGGSAPSGSGGVSGSPDLFISEFSMTPETPTQGSPVTVRVGVYNKGNSASGPFTVQWWPGENYGAPACSWTLDGMVARGGQILTCTYEGYPSWYAKIDTKVVADPAGEVAESDESNNVYKKTISVSKPGSAPSDGSAPPGGSSPSWSESQIGSEDSAPPSDSASSGGFAPPGSSGVSGSPDLFISEFSMTPETPTQGSPVTVRVGVYNKGNSASGPFTVQWWPGENYGAPACSWTLDGMVARGGRILTCTYEGYPSWYAKINTKVVADPTSEVAESDESNNVYKKTISVSKPGSAPSGGSSPSGGSVPSGSSGVSGSPDLFISEFSMTPETPTQGSPVTVRVGVYNKGNSASGPFTVQWWPGENYGAPACSWTQDGMVARGGRILTCTYEGYPSWYAKINTKVVADTAGAVAESDESNNVYKKTISVNRP